MHAHASWFTCTSRQEVAFEEPDQSPLMPRPLPLRSCDDAPRDSRYGRPVWGLVKLQDHMNYREEAYKKITVLSQHEGHKGLRNGYVGKVPR